MFSTRMQTLNPSRILRTLQINFKFSSVPEKKPLTIPGMSVPVSELPPLAPPLSLGKPLLPTRVKHKIPWKRLVFSHLIDIPIFFNLLEHSASKLHGELLREEYNNLKNGRQWPEINPGDAVEVERYPYVTAKKYEKVKGVVMGIYNRHSDTSIKLLNVRRLF
jgi:hypothetical protein